MQLDDDVGKVAASVPLIICILVIKNFVIVNMYVVFDLFPSTGIYFHNYFMRIPFNWDTVLLVWNSEIHIMRNLDLTCVRQLGQWNCFYRRY